MESKTITTDLCKRLSDERAVLEGNFSFPYDVSDISSVLDICGCAEIISAKSENERILVNGKARFTVLCCTRSGYLDSFDSECSFEHIVAFPDASPDMTVAANASICATTWRINGNEISLRSELSIDLLASFPIHQNVIAIEKNDLMECDQCTAETISCSTKSIKAYANSELRVPQNMPEIQKILLTSADVALRSIQRESERIIIEGEFCICIAYESKDKNAPLQYFSESFPFGEIIKDPSCTEDSQIFAELSVDRITAELSSADMISIAGVVSVNTLCINKHEQEFVRDLYALKGSSEATHCHIPLIYPVMHDCIQKTLRTDTEIPESAPEAARVLFATAHPEITGVISDNGFLSVDGILHINLTYSTVDAGIKSVRIKEPFELSLGNYPQASAVKAFCSAASAQGSGRNIDLKISFELCIFEENDCSLDAVDSVSYSDTPVNTASGIIVYFADDGERIWDICKKYSVPRSAAIPLDSSEEPFCRGDRVLFMR